jgi:hypothetical protein
MAYQKPQRKTINAYVAYVTGKNEQLQVQLCNN